MSADRLSDRVDAALEAFWGGTSDALWRLLRDEDEPDKAASDARPDMAPGVELDVGPGTEPWSDDTPPPGARLEFPGYDVIREVGRGSMGVVYEVTHGGERLALKVLRRPLAHDPFHTRLFRREIRALRQLRHPAIVCLRDAGQTPDGVSYFTMDLIEGRTLSAALKPEKRTTERAVAILSAVARGVHHAHQKGVIHRDLKPSNILIDREGRPHVLDFGLARLSTSVDAPGETIVSRGRVMGTLPYLSPEQVEAGEQGIDLRSDVYALGVILYEMLTGVLPLAIPTTNLHAAVRMICSGSRPRLRDRRPDLSGDLDVIVGKAMEPDLRQRYQSAEALADDLDRYLNREPIRARRPGGFYQVRQLARRHRVVSSLIGVLALTLLLATATVSVLAVSLADQRDVAQDGWDQARLETLRAQAIHKFMLTILAAANPETGDRHVTVRGALDDAIARLDEHRGSPPDVQAAIRTAMADLLTEFGEFDAATPLYESALALEREAHPRGSHETALYLRNLAGNRYDTGAYEAALPLLRESLAVTAAQGETETAFHARTLNDLALIHHVRGELDDAVELQMRVLEIRRAVLPEGHEQIRQSLLNLGALEIRLERYDEAERSLQRALTLAREYGEEPVQASPVLSQLSYLYTLTDRGEEALEICRANVDLCRKHFGADHPRSWDLVHQEGVALMSLDRSDEAIPVFRSVEKAWATQLGGSHPWVAVCRMNLGECLLAADRLEEAARVLEAAAPVLESAYGAEHEYTRKTEMMAGDVARRRTPAPPTH